MSVSDRFTVVPFDADHHGYNMVPKTWWYYAFLSKDTRRVKVGLVGREDRLRPRLVEVTRRYEEMDLKKVAAVSIPGLTQPEAEDAEAALRLWLTRAGGLVHYPRTDWLFAPEGKKVDWQKLLDRGRDAVVAWGG